MLLHYSDHRESHLTYSPKDNSDLALFHTQPDLERIYLFIINTGNVKYT